MTINTIDFERLEVDRYAKIINRANTARKLLKIVLWGCILAITIIGYKDGYNQIMSFSLSHTNNDLNILITNLLGISFHILIGSFSVTFIIINALSWDNILKNMPKYLIRSTQVATFLTIIWFPFLQVNLEHELWLDWFLWVSVPYFLAYLVSQCDARELAIVASRIKGEKRSLPRQNQMTRIKETNDNGQSNTDGGE